MISKSQCQENFYNTKSGEVNCSITGRVLLIYISIWVSLAVFIGMMTLSILSEDIPRANCNNIVINGIGYSSLPGIPGTKKCVKAQEAPITTAPTEAPTNSPTEAPVVPGDTEAPVEAPSIWDLVPESPDTSGLFDIVSNEVNDALALVISSDQYENRFPEWFTSWIYTNVAIAIISLITVSIMFTPGYYEGPYKLLGVTVNAKKPSLFLKFAETGWDKYKFLRLKPTDNYAQGPPPNPNITEWNNCDKCYKRINGCSAFKRGLTSGAIIIFLAIQLIIVGGIILAWYFDIPDEDSSSTNHFYNHFYNNNSTYIVNNSNMDTSYLLDTSKGKQDEDIAWSWFGGISLLVGILMLISGGFILSISGSCPRGSGTKKYFAGDVSFLTSLFLPFYQI